MLYSPLKSQRCTRPSGLRFAMRPGPSVTSRSHDRDVTEGPSRTASLEPTAACSTEEIGTSEEDAGGQEKQEDPGTPHGNQGKHRVTKRGPALSYPMFTLVTSEDIAGSIQEAFTDTPCALQSQECIAVSRDDDVAVSRDRYVIISRDCNAWSGHRSVARSGKGLLWIRGTDGRLTGSGVVAAAEVRRRQRCGDDERYGVSRVPSTGEVTQWPGIQCEQQSQVHHRLLGGGGHLPEAALVQMECSASRGFRKMAAGGHACADGDRGGHFSEAEFADLDLGFRKLAAAISICARAASRSHFPEAPGSRALHLRTRGLRKMAAAAEKPYTPQQGKIALCRHVLRRTENELQSNIAASMQPAGRERALDFKPVPLQTG
ncbi:unnamed protein product [Ranitomeya imitator]|uniref:Uncharacterized protein n=1 Tax=Ranitomeya imitator TaxID=111125 RepID=A0ABN9LIS9_9NEOB|nr:unnamed protein product [Ranitomeya imitator]